MRKKREVAVILFAGLFLLAATPQFKKFHNQDILEKGKSSGISIDALGQLTLAPRLDEYLAATLPHLWCVEVDQQGSFLVGGGNPATVLRIRNDRKIDTVFTSQELSVFALAISRDNLYLATSPDGQVYRKNLTREEPPKPFFDPGAKYIWDMVSAENGSIFVATGEPAKIYRISSAGDSTVLLESEEQHIRSLYWEKREQALYAGSSGNAYLYRIKAGDKIQVLYDAPDDEINEIRVSKTGTVYLAAAGSGGIRPTMPPTSTQDDESTDSSDDAEGIIVISAISDSDQSSSASLPSVRQPQGQSGAVYRIPKSGTADKLWSSRQEQAHALYLQETSSDGETRVLVGTGNRGKIYQIDQDKDRTLVLEVESSQITSMVGTKDQQIVLATANPGSVQLLRPGARRQGEYESEVIDAAVPSQWGTLSWRDNGSGKIQVWTRSGNTGKPDQTWSAWQSVEVSVSGGKIQSPAARFLQWKVALESTGGQKPLVKQLAVSYLQENVAPEITRITVYQQDFSFQNGSAGSGNSRTSGKNGNAANLSASSRPQSGSNGAQLVSWSANDENDDDLIFKVEIKSTDEAVWHELTKEHERKAYSFDSQSLPDGEYQIRIHASDKPGNPPALAKSSEKISTIFVIDNTAPDVSEITLKSENKLLAHFTVEDALSEIKEAYFTLDAGDWQLVYPQDHVADERREEYSIELPKESKNKLLAVKVIDVNGNIGFGKIKVTF